MHSYIASYILTTRLNESRINQIYLLTHAPLIVWAYVGLYAWLYTLKALATAASNLHVMFACNVYNIHKCQHWIKAIQ